LDRLTLANSLKRLAWKRMKSNRRHELQTNELADWLGERVERLKPHVVTITLGAALVLGLLLGGIWYFGSEDQASAQTWGSYFGAFNQREPGKALEKLAADKPRAAAALWALQSLGDMNLAQGAALLFSNRAEAQTLLQKAEANYKQIIASPASDASLKARAQLGLGKVYESLCKPDEASKYYEQVAESNKDSTIGKVAAVAAARMKDERDTSLLAWFAQQTPKKPAPLPGFGSSGPKLPNDLPERPDISLPPGLGLDNLGTATPSEPAPAFPAPGAPTTPPAPAEGTKPDGGKPDEKPPAEEKTEAGKPGSP
jgi:tetratricopeptide (TPR) repeat protein